MKRYQCISNFIAFSKGRIYSEIDGPPSHEGGADLILHDGRVYEITETDMFYHFQELQDLHVDDIPRDEADREPFMTPEPKRGLPGRWAYFIVIVITIVLLIYKAYTE